MIRRTLFQKIVTVCVVAGQIGCTTVRPIEATPDALHERIRQGDLIKVGDAVNIFTEDEKEHRFLVTAIDADTIQGEGSPPASYDPRRGTTESQRTKVTIPIDSIVAVQTREVSVGKTALLAGGITGLMLLIFIVTAPVAILAASSP